MTKLLCQSCGMPMDHEELKGTERDGSQSDLYCKYCYDQGEFVNPDMTQDEMIEICVPHMVQDGMDESQARAMISQMLPQLKRWQVNTDTAHVIEPVTVTRDEMKVIGIATRTTNACEAGPEGAIPKLWQQFFEEQVGSRIPNQSEAPALLGLYTNYESDITGEYDMVIGMTVNTLESIPDGMVGQVIPAAKYVVFTSPIGPLMEIIPATWHHIWQWMQHTEEVRTYTGDFELYDARSSNPNAAQVDIYIAIQ
ncbi:zinc ribbon domain-containing protein [Paenibacillus sp. N1-5-1-14]|uniref:effector binding domain-containing protein n=1 Tax=Paenibacillus radicibacter TaxID=2972488 RepID=UPI002159A270|nr:zinc ribbon domain-containing protein [Paenibacillus radicibacter]MCR8644678.1 zinc ribbon domain-containing protein [Paenibacillus radicibacter]